MFTENKGHPYEAIHWDKALEQALDQALQLSFQLENLFCLPVGIARLICAKSPSSSKLNSSSSLSSSFWKGEYNK